MRDSFVDGKAVLTLVAAAMAAGVLAAMPLEVALRLSDEDGPIEVATAAVFAVGAMICFLRCRGAGADRLCGAVVLAALCLRELDFHKRFTSRAISSTRFYLSAEIPQQEKLLVVLALGLVVVALVRLGWVAWRHLPGAVRQRAVWVGHMALGLGMLGVSRAAEKTNIAALYPLEEVCELGFGVFMLWVVLTVPVRRL